MLIKVIYPNTGYMAFVYGCLHQLLLHILTVHEIHVANVIHLIHVCAQVQGFIQVELTSPAVYSLK